MFVPTRVPLEHPGPMGSIGEGRAGLVSHRDQDGDGTEARDCLL